MHADEDEIALLVQAFGFELLNSSGVPILDMTEVAGPPVESQFVFHHLAPLADDSLLRWSTSSLTNPFIALQGPGPVAASLPGEWPALQMSWSSGTGEKLLLLTSGKAGGGASLPQVTLRADGAAGASALIGSDSNVQSIWRASDVFHTYQTQWAVFEVGGNYRLLLDATYLQILARDVLMNNAKVIRAYDTGGVIRGCLFPRWNDDRCYLDGGAGLNLRANNGSYQGITIEAGGYVNIGQAWMNQQTLYFYNATDTNHGVGYRSSFGATPCNGPALFGFDNVTLGTTNGGQQYFLQGNTTGDCGIRRDMYVQGGYYRGGGNTTSGSFGGNGAVLRTDSNGNGVHFNWDSVALREYVDATLVKSFVIPHPQYKERLLVHACAEGPTADVHYRGEGRLVDGLALVELPDYFEALTELEGRTVQVTPIAEPERFPAGVPELAAFGLLPSLAVSRVVDGKFYVVIGSGHQLGDVAFYWHVHAVRKGTAFEVEPAVADVELGGDGPYRYVKGPKG